MAHGMCKSVKRACYRFVPRHAYPDLLEEEFSCRTVIPRFKYHRFSVDCARFHPDWFGAAAQSLDAEVVERNVNTEAHIVYCLRKP